MSGPGLVEFSALVVLEDCILSCAHRVFFRVQRSFVPLDLAKKRISDVVEAMVNMKAKHIDLVGELDANYKSIEVSIDS